MCVCVCGGGGGDTRGGWGWRLVFNFLVMANKGDVSFNGAAILRLEFKLRVFMW